MLHDWQEQMDKMDKAKQDYYSSIKQRSHIYSTIPLNRTKAIEVLPEEFDAFLMACILKADAKYRLTPFSFALFDYYLNSFQRRFKNPVKAWYHTATLHCFDTITDKNGHFRLIEHAEYQYGA
jgi:hypothetical protein